MSGGKENIGLILFGHGSRDPGWREPFFAVERRLAALGVYQSVRAAFMKECEPALHDAAAQMTLAGVTQIVVAPLFLASGAHQREDFPRIAKELAEAFPEVDFRWTDAVGAWEETQAALATVIGEKVTGELFL